MWNKFSKKSPVKYPTAEIVSAITKNNSIGPHGDGYLIIKEIKREIISAWASADYPNFLSFVLVT
ncbi:unnamed protein product [marine sediment metagenome]|uniref:Uncharacterized protein n=1 Tax=marine sediment metagenome TaxID=412755 RepID=X1LIB7_9ZZZZ